MPAIGRHILSLAALAAMSLATQAARGDEVERRGGAPPLVGDVVAVDDEGVHVRSALGAAQAVPWDRVRAVRSAKPLPNLSERLARAEAIWRARSRIERGDTLLAEPLLEPLFARSLGGPPGETSLVIAEGLLRCRLARGEQTGAVLPALEVARLRRAGIQTSAYTELPAVLDDATLLSPYLPPVLPAGPARDRLGAEIDAWLARNPGDAVDPVLRALGQGYRDALVLTPDAAPALPEGAMVSSDLAGEMKVLRDHDGVALLRGMLASASADPAQRLAGRERLGRLELPEPWQQAWARFFIGVSMLRDEPAATRQRGVVELLHVPAGFAAAQPWLSGAALDVAAAALRRDGVTPEAAILERELDILHPYHPLRAERRQPGARSAPRTTS